MSGGRATDLPVGGGECEVATLDVLAALHREALAESRRLKPSIPEIGAYGIPLRDELELEGRLRS
jgi:hypothetical protein